MVHTKTTLIRKSWKVSLRDVCAICRWNEFHTKRTYHGLDNSDNFRRNFLSIDKWEVSHSKIHWHPLDLNFSDLFDEVYLIFSGLSFGFCSIQCQAFLSWSLKVIQPCRIDHYFIIIAAYCACALKEFHTWLLPFLYNFAKSR